MRLREDVAQFQSPDGLEHDDRRDRQREEWEARRRTRQRRDYEL